MHTAHPLSNCVNDTFTVALTAAGRAAVREWLRSGPETPHLRAPILARLAGADLLSDGELDAVLARYAEDVHLTRMGLEEMQRRGSGTRLGSERQGLVWQYVNDRPLRMLRVEEDWVGELRWALAKLEKDGTPTIPR